MENIDITYHSVVQFSQTGGTYKSNEHSSISESLMQEAIAEDELQYFEKIQKVVHQNLMNIHEVFLGSTNETNVCYAKPENNDYFSQVDEIFDVPFFTNMFAELAKSRNLKLFVTDIVNGLKELHQNLLYHGNLNLKTTYFCLVGGSYCPTIKLGGFKHRSGLQVDLMLDDWHSLGILLKELPARLPQTNLTKHEELEFEDLYQSLIKKDMCLDNDLKRSKNSKEQSIICGDFVLKHPVFLDARDMSAYIILSIKYLESKKLTKYLRTEDVFGVKNPDINLVPYLVGTDLEDNLRENKLLEDKLIEVKAIPYKFSEMPAESKGFLFGKMARNLLSHEPYDSTLPIGKQFGTTSPAICTYFREFHPNLLLAIHKAVMRTEYRFEGFFSLSPRDLVWHLL